VTKRKNPDICFSPTLHMYEPINIEYIESVANVKEKIELIRSDFHFKESFNLSSAICDVINWLISEKDVFSHQTPHSRTKIDLYKAAMESLQKAKKNIEKFMPGMREELAITLGSAQPLYLIEDNIDLLINGIFVTGSKIKNDKGGGVPTPSKKEMIRQFIEIYIAGTEKEIKFGFDSVKDKNCGELFFFLIRIKELLKIINPELKLGADSTIGKHASEITPLLRKST